MLTEWWERMRGYDRWTEAEAVIEGPEPGHEESGRPEKGRPFADALVWTDHRGRRHSAPFVVPDHSPLYQKVSGDMVVIRYNPRRPERFYFRELHRTRIRAMFTGLLIAAFLLAVIVMAFWVRG